MKRYLLFMYFLEPRGGWRDFFSSFNDVEAALTVVGSHQPNGWQIVDTHTGKIVVEVET